MSDTLEVFCRLKPCPQEDSCVQAIDDKYVKIVQPRGYDRRGNTPSEAVYKFTEVFDESCGQRDVFNRASLDLIRGALNGVDGLLFTYGTTGSGKTHTITGEPRNAGILPRAVDVVFNSLPNPTERCVFYPTSLNRFGIRSETEAAYARRELQIPDIRSPVREFESLSIKNVPMSMASAVFVSYVEIYNEYCYDLFDESITASGNRLNKTKEIRAGPRDAAYVEGLVEIEVTSTDEVMWHYEKAQERRRIAETKLNSQSSRSHSIFQIKIVMAPFQDDSYYPDTDPNKIIISQMVLVDLAGSERANRTGNMGERLVEASKINNSLMCLRQCFERYRANQRNPKQPNVVPYRDSKITHLFKKYFLGGGNIRMIICVDPRSENYGENLNVFSFAELSQDIKIELTDVPDIPSGNSLPFPRRDILNWYRFIEKNVNMDPLKLDLFPPPPKRICLDDSNDTNISRIEENLSYYKNRMTRKAQLMDVFADRRRQFGNDLKTVLCERDLSKIRVQNLEQENSELNHRLEVLHKQVLHMNRENAALKRRLFEYEEVDEKRYLAEMELRKKNAMIEKDLERKNRDFRVVRQICEDISISGETGPSVAALASKFDTGSGGQKVPRTPAQQKTTTFAPEVIPTSKQGRRNGYVNPKFHRRSRSAAGRILDHQPVNRVPTGNILQPQLPKLGVKTTFAPSPRDLKRSDAYILTHQEVDNKGNISTNIVKGECIPTSGGGRYVEFTDIENLQHSSPSVV
uniref:Kinesin-like protein n=1 Tax=Strongyloides papillosus TaxID=174720 RepID=A0A0N5BBY6_STREA